MASQKEVNIEGSDLSGNDGDTNRTYTLTGTVSTTGIRVYVNGVFKHQGALLDYTYSANVITFLEEIFDNQVIAIFYFSTDDATATGTYCSVADVRRILLNSFEWDTVTNPTESQVIKNMEAATAEIDNTTQHAWRETTVTEEYYNLPKYANPIGGYCSGLEVHLRHREIKDFDTDEGDKIEIWDGSSWVDWIATKTEGRANDFWQDNEGILFLRYTYPFFIRKALRMTYRFGSSTIPNDIRDACAKMAAIGLIRMDDKSANLNETGDPTRQTHDTRIKDMQKEIENVLKNRTEMFVIC